VAQLVQLPAICDNCGTVWSLTLPFRAEEVETQDCVAEPCPKCGGQGTIPDGLYRFVGETLKIVQAWSPEQREALRQAINAAREQTNPRRAVQEAITKDPDLADIAKKLLIPRNAGEFWVLVTVLLTALALLAAVQAGTRTTVNEHTVIEQVLKDPATARAPERKRPPPPPRRRQ
jgi:hypothetical protein